MNRLLHFRMWCGRINVLQEVLQPVPKAEINYKETNPSTRKTAFSGARLCGFGSHSLGSHFGSHRSASPKGQFCFVLYIVRRRTPALLIQPGGRHSERHSPCTGILTHPLPRLSKASETMGTSKLQQQTAQVLYSEFYNCAIRENCRPEWLLDATGRRLELDFWIDELDIAIEVQGSQHYQYSSLFHASYEDFIDQQRRDKLKREACAEYGITLLLVHDDLDLQEAVITLRMAAKTAQQYPAKNAACRRIDKAFAKWKKAIRRKKPNPKIRNYNSIRDLVLFYMDELPPAYLDRCVQFLDQATKLLTEQGVFVPKTPRKRGKEIGRTHPFYTTYYDQCEQWGLSTYKIGNRLKRADKELSASHVREDRYIVNGGELPHEVIVTSDYVTCDCSAFIKDGTACSHIAKVFVEFLQCQS